MTRTRKPGARKRHHTERFRGPNLFVERWPNSKAGTVGFHLGSGKTSVEVSDILSDGTSPETIRCLSKKWRLPLHQIGRSSKSLVLVTSWQSRKKLDRKAEELGITTGELVRRIIETAAHEDLYNAITDGKYDSVDAKRREGGSD